MRKILKVLGISLLTLTILNIKSVYATNDTTIETSNTISTTVVDGTNDTYNVTVSITGKGVTATTINPTESTDVILLLDTSGSMSGNKLITAKQSAKEFTDQLLVPGSNNTVSIIGFNSTATTHIAFSNDKAAVHSAIDAMSATGTTNMADGIAMSDTLITTNGRSGSQKVLVLLSDGAPNSTTDAYGKMDTIIANHPDLIVKTIGYNITSAAANILLTLAQKDTVNGAYFDASTDDLTSIFDGIYSSIFSAIQRTHVYHAIPDNFEIVEGSLTNPNTVSVNMAALANNQIDVTTGSLSNNQTVSFSYQIRIKQDQPIPQQNIPFVFDYEYDYNDGDSLQTKTYSEQTNVPIYKVTTSTDGNGSISNSRYVGRGAKYDISWAANAGYVLDGLRINLENIAVNENTYTLTNIQNDYDIHASFKKINSTITPASINRPATSDATNSTTCFSILGISTVLMLYQLKKKK